MIGHWLDMLAVWWLRRRGYFGAAADLIYEMRPWPRDADIREALQRNRAGPD